MVCYTGDMFNNYAEEMARFTHTLSKVNARDGSYSILGNHDYGDYSDWNNDSLKAVNFKGIIQMHEEANIRVLRDESVVFKRGNTSINLLGVDFWKEEPKYRRGNLQKALQGIDTNLFTILLTHAPEHWEKEVLHYPNIDLTLTGHIHGAQVGIQLWGIEFSPAQLLHRKIGRFSVNGQVMYVNRGFGCVGYPGRPGMQPEITLIELQKKR